MKKLYWTLGVGALATVALKMFKFGFWWIAAVITVGVAAWQYFKK